MHTIFLVEDDKIVREQLSQLLQKYAYNTIATENFETVCEDVLRANPDLVLLDINLPHFDGYHICKEIRKESNVPIIIVTSRDSEMDELMSMNLGADDYVTKPYNTQILLARISSVLKRANQTAANNDIVSYKDVRLDTLAATVSYKDSQIELSKNEVRILHLLMQKHSTIVTRSDIMNHLWQSDQFIDDNTLTVNINRLRKKLEGIGIEDFLVTKRGQGYMV